MEICTTPQTTSNIIISEVTGNINIYLIADPDRIECELNTDSAHLSHSSGFSSDGIECELDTDIQSDKHTNNEIEELKRLVSDIYDLKKQNNMKLAARYQMIAKKSTELSTDDYYARKYQRLEQCSTYLEFRREKSTKKYKLINTNLCRVRLCPLCAYKRSLSVYHNTADIINYINEKYNRSKYLFLTLTIRNVAGSELSNAIDNLTRAWQNMSKQKRIKNVVLGTVRSIEITYNKRNNTYHPHLHVLIHTTADIYAGRNYISQAEFSDRWRSAAGIDYEPVIDIRRLRHNGGREVAEIAKYSVKPLEWDKCAESVIITLDEVLHKRHLLSLSGTMREAKRALKIADIEDKKEWLQNFDEGDKILFFYHFSKNKYNIAAGC